MGKRAPTYIVVDHPQYHSHPERLPSGILPPPRLFDHSAFARRYANILNRAYWTGASGPRATLIILHISQPLARFTGTNQALGLPYERKDS